MMRFGWLAACGAATVAACTPGTDELRRSEQAVTTCTTIQRGVAGDVRDAMLSSPPASNNFGDLPIVRVGGKDEGLFWFALDSIPTNAVIDHATMTLYVSGDPGNAPIAVHRATAAWSEATVSFASFDQQFAFDASGILNPTSANAFKSVGVTTLVRDWVSGAWPNDGLLLETASQKKTIFASSEAGATAQRPALEICYSTPDDHCAGDPCQHGGTCANETDGYTCTCAAGYTGTNCETAISACDSYPCQHGGTCNDSGTSYTCTCAAGYTGTNCETVVDNCATAPCQNGGTCTNGVDSYTCSCPAEFTGTNCEIHVDDCADDPCQNGGTCTDGEGGYTCACAPGYTGASCEILVDNCTPGLCQNEGTCINQVNGYTCACAAGYTGTNCETVIDNCTADACTGHGTCTSGVGTYTCACDPGFAGDHCDVDIDECAAAPCQHGGTCIDEVNGYICQCVAPYSGATCEAYPTDPCLFAGGTLVPYTGNYTITNQASIDALFCVDEITGTLTIDAEVAVTEISLPSLHKTAGLRVAPTSRVPTIGLANLDTVTNLVDVQSNPSVVSVELSSLAHAGGFYVKDNGALATFDAGHLSSTNSVTFANNAELTTLGPDGLGQLATMTQTLAIQNNPKLASLGANGLSALTAADRVVIDNNAVLTSLGPSSLGAATSLPHGLELIGNPLTAVDLGHVTNLGQLYVEGNPGLATLALGTLPATMSYFDIKHQPLLDLDANALAGVQTITVDTIIVDTGIRDLTYNGLTSVGRNIEIGDNAQLATVSMPNLATNGVAIPGGLTSVYRNAALHSFSAPGAMLGGVIVDANPVLTTFRYDHLLPSVRYANLTTNPLLSDLGPHGFSDVQQVVVDMRIRAVPLVTSLGPTELTALASVGRDLELQQTSFSTLSLPSLTTVGSAALGGTLAIWSNPQLQAVDAPNADVKSLSVDNNPQLTALHFAGFQPATRTVALTRQPALADITATAFSSLGSIELDLQITSTALPNLPLGSVTSVGRNVQLVSNPNMTAVDLGNLISVGGLYNGALYIQANPNLVTIDASAATQLGGFIITDDPQLATFHFAGTTDAVSYAVLRNVPQLVDLGPVGFGTVRTVGIDLEVNGTGLTSLGAAGLDNVATVGRSLIVSGNPNLTSVSLTSLTEIGGAFPPGDVRVIDNAALVSFDAPNATIGGFYVFQDPQLVRFRYAHIKPNIGNAILRYLPNLAEVGAPGLSEIRTVTGTLLIEGTALTSFGPRGLSDLVSVGSGVRIASCPSVTSLGPDGLGALQTLDATATGGLDLFWMSALQTFRAPLITSMSGRLYVDNNAQLATLELDALTHVGDSFQITNNVALPACVPSSLVTQIGYAGTPIVYNNGPTCP